MKIFGLLVALYVTQASALNILVLNCLNSRSHFVFLNVLTTALLEKGHKIHELVILPTPKHPNRTTFAITDKIRQFQVDNLSDLTKRTDSMGFYGQAQFAIRNCKGAFESQATKDLLALARDLKRRPKIDVVVIDYVFGHCVGGFAKEFGNPPIIAITAFGNPVEIDNVLGSPFFPSFVPHDMTVYSRHDTMTWKERLHNKMVYLLGEYYRLTLLEPTFEDLMKKFFGNNAATIAEIRRNVSLALVNSHPAIQGARPQLPAIVEIGGIHVAPAKELPAGDLKDFLDTSKDGFILMSFGSVLRASAMEPSRRKVLMRAFERLKPLRIVFKWEEPWNAQQDGQLPSNVFLSPWLPQSDILAHPNIRLFVTHCGLLSVYEIISRAVPVVGVPLLFDQFLNAKDLAAVNVAKILPYKDLTEESFYNTVQTVLADERYAQSARRLSAIFHDQQSPKDRAVYWVEFIGRHGSATFLRSPSEKLTWVARWMIDDVLILFVVVFGLITGVRYLVKLCIQIRTGTEKLKDE